MVQQYAEADATQTERIVNAMHKFMTLVHTIWVSNDEGNPSMGFQFGYQYVRWEEVKLLISAVVCAQRFLACFGS